MPPSYKGASGRAVNRPQHAPSRLSIAWLIGTWLTVWCPLASQAQDDEGFEEIEELDETPVSEESDSLDDLNPDGPSTTPGVPNTPEPGSSTRDPQGSGARSGEAGTRSRLTPDYALRLQELEDRVNDLQEQIFRSKSRLVLLREQVMRTAIGGCQARIRHMNDMSATFDMVQVIYSLDGNQLFSATDRDGSLADDDSIDIYDGAILPGPHNISVEMIFVGNGFGIFSYLEGYRFRVRSSYAFTAEDGKIANLDIVAYEQGGINQPIEERPDIRYELEFTDSVVVEE